MSAKTLRIATRKSPLALWQAEHIKEQLLKLWPTLSIELVPMVTSGDKFLKDKLLAAGGKGLFVKELEEALLANKADIAVHSTKDMPAFLPQGLCLPVICKRDNPYDALVSSQYADLKSLPQQAVIGTSSLRRQSQLLAYRPDLQIKTLRGNIHTRLAKLESGEYDAIILAAAGLERMNFQDVISELLPAEIMLPTCGQGALSVECRENDPEFLKLIAPLTDSHTALCVQTERAVNAQLGGNCHVPLAVFCTITEEQQLYLRARLLSIDGSAILSFEGKALLSEAAQLVKQCTDALFAQGATSFIQSS
jgi:hydroxymethylbilane synthase